MVNGVIKRARNDRICQENGMDKNARTDQQLSKNRMIGMNGSDEMVKMKFEHFYLHQLSYIDFDDIEV
jgi:hypothetical protein